VVDNASTSPERHDQLHQRWTLEELRCCCLCCVKREERRVVVITADRDICWKTHDPVSHGSESDRWRPGSDSRRTAQGR